MSITHLVTGSLFAAAGMFWEIFWALILGFALSGAVMAFIPKNRIARGLGRPGAREIGLALFLGAASSSCSYAAASMTKSIFRKGAHIIPALAFLLASTNLVIELSAVLWILLGWQFVVAEFLGGLILVFVMSTLMRYFGPLQAFEEKRRELSQGGAAGMEGESEDTVADPKTLQGWKVAARSFVMEWKMIWKDILLGVVISGVLMVCVPNSFWQSLFLQSGTNASQPSFLQIVENALVGPLISVLSFVCSVGNIPLAGVLYRGGISFGGAISFIYADLIILPLILVYSRYFGWRLALWITGIFYVSMVATGVIIDLLFLSLGWVPLREPGTSMTQMHSMRFFELNYTFWLNIVFAVLGGVLYWLARSGSDETTEAECCHHE